MRMRIGRKIFCVSMGAAITFALSFGALAGAIYWLGKMGGLWGVDAPPKGGLYAFHSEQVTESILIRPDRTYVQHLKMGGKDYTAEGQWRAEDSNVWGMSFPSLYTRDADPEKGPTNSGGLARCVWWGHPRQPRLVFFRVQTNGNDEDYYLERVDAPQ